ncbi:MAG TPA: S9 family peptidase [Ramlibacter sp.]|nr:S9 family peptidase [Ramlibacter sp.]
MPQPFQPEDLYRHRKLTAVDCTANARAAVAAVRSVDRQENSYRSHLWLFPLDGGAPRQLTSGKGKDTAPCWSPGGDRIAFLSDGDGTVQMHLLPAEGGEARRCGHFRGGVTAVRWCANGRSLLVTAAVKVDPELRGARGPQPAERKADAPEVAWRLPYKTDGLGYQLDREIHLFRIDAATGVQRQLTDGAFDVYGFDGSPDGRQVVFVRTRGGRLGHRTELWVCDAQGADARLLTRAFSSVLQPAWSPDGRWIAFAAAVEDGAAQWNLHLWDCEQGRVQRLGDPDLEVADGSSLRWSEDGAQLFFTRAHRGCHDVCAIARDGTQLRVLAGGERQFGAFATDGRRLVYSLEHPVRPSELFCCALDGSGERALSDLNPWWRDRTPLQAHRRAFRVPDGRGGQETIEGWLIRAEGAEGPQPLLDDVHGGPASYALLDFDTNVFWQVLCSHGWSVLALNAVGSASYGREFCERLCGHWGEMDLPQHLAAIRQLQEEGVCDERVGIAGKSYGGYLTAWAMGHTEDFKAGIVMAPVGNIETHYGTSDGGYYADPRYVGSTARFDRRRARELSPLQSIEDSTTPVLFLQGKEDERCPKCQSEEMFVSLLCAGDTPTELVLYPGQNHHFLGEGAPSCRLDAARRIVDWLQRWCAPVLACTEDREEASA